MRNRGRRRGAALLGTAEHFVVVGYANKVATEVMSWRVKRTGFRFCGAVPAAALVVQGPGCLNYTLVLRITADGPLHNIGVANQFIMRQNRAAMESSLRTRPAWRMRGHTDLAIGERKFSGNAQRRRKHFLLFHGTFLLNFDLALVSELLPMPSKQPDYREHRATPISDQLERVRKKSEGGVATGLESGGTIKKSAAGKDYGSGAGEIRHARVEL